MKRLIVEIKARCGDHGAARKFLTSRGAAFKGTDHQVDTYFRVARGRLKLREGEIENFLIFYERKNQAEPKESNVILMPSQPGSALKEMLSRSLDVVAVVDKSREIYFIDNVKFHLDTVKNLGAFIEIEAIESEAARDKEALLRQCTDYRALLGVRDADLIPGSYSDLLLAEAATAARGAGS